VVGRRRGCQPENLMKVESVWADLASKNQHVSPAQCAK
jgi:hypothetical protein